MNNHIKSHILVALFILFTSNAIAHEIKSLNEVASSKIWQSLLHSSDNKPQITSRNFLLSGNNFSNSRELELTLSLINTDPQSAFCKYPARSLFLSDALNINISDYASALEHCPELKRYIDHVPIDDLELVFASEIFSSASSMMGHIFLKANGKNYRDVEVSHSLAFFTEITTLNPFSLIKESLITGMPGFFTVRPFKQDQHKYLDIEKRNLWLFRLSGDEFKKRLLQLHLWELKALNLTYYFQSYNCATLTLELIALLNPSVLIEKKLFVSPVDVLKAAKKHGLVSQTQVIASPNWLLNSLYDELTASQKYQLTPLLTTKNIDKARKLPLLSQKYLALASANWYEALGDSIDVDLADYKHPAMTPQDSAIGISLIDNSADARAQLSFLASGHYLFADNRQYLYESELLLGKVVTELNFDKNSVKLSEATIYSVKNLAPSTQHNSTWSSELYLGYRPSYNDSLNPDSVGEISFGLGKSIQLHKDLLVYSHGVTGLTSNLAHIEWFAQLKAGIVTDLVHDTKLTVEVSWGSGKIHKTNTMMETTIKYSWFINNANSVSLSLESVKDKLQTNTSMSLSYNLYF